MQAAKQVADALAQGATTIQGSLQRLAEYSETMDHSLANARNVVASLEGYANKLQSGVSGLNQPLIDAASALSRVGTEVRDATAAIRSERDSLGTLGTQLAGQAGALKSSTEALALRIAEYKGLQQTLSTEWANHIRGVDALLSKIKQSWVDAAQAADSGLQQNAAQLARYAQDVEKALRLPGDLRKLDETMDALTDVLSDLAKAVAR